MKFIDVNGSKIRSDIITAVRIADKIDPSDCSPKGHASRVIVDFGDKYSNNCIVVDCGSDEERNKLRDKIMAEIALGETK